MLKKILFCVVFSAVQLSAFAAYKLIWVWKIPDPKVTWVRYKINADEENDIDWTYLASSPDEPTSIVMDVEKDKFYTIYVQDSYDGVWWSESSVKDVDTSVLGLFDGEDDGSTGDEAEERASDAVTDVLDDGESAAASETDGGIEV